MRTLSVTVAAGMTLLCLVNVSAQDEKDVGLSRDYAACLEKSGGVTSKMLDCIGAETERQETRLNKIYKRIMAQLDGAGKKRLREAQQAWIKFRDANVDFYKDPNGGTAATLAGADRYLVMTTERASELEKFKE